MAELRHATAAAAAWASTSPGKRDVKAAPASSPFVPSHRGGGNGKDGAPRLSPTFHQRYLYIRWGLELSNMTVVVGESGDTDYDGLLGGVHKTIILKGSFNAARNQLHASRSYSLQDVVSFDKPGIASVEGYGPDILKSALQQLGVLKD